MINLNEISTPVLQDERVREALDLSLDRDAMIEKLCFGEGNYTGPVSWGLEFWSLPQDELRTRYRRDVEKARRLLDAAGVQRPHPGAEVPDYDTADLASMIKEQAAEAGITINIRAMELGAWVADLFSQNFELMVSGGLPYGDENLPLQFNHTYNWTRKQKPGPPAGAGDRRTSGSDLGHGRSAGETEPRARRDAQDHRPSRSIPLPLRALQRSPPAGTTSAATRTSTPALIAYTYDMWLDT